MTIHSYSFISSKITAICGRVVTKARAGGRRAVGRENPQWLRGKPRSTPAGVSAGSGQRVVTTLPRV
jgi:hypothetical protein